jgi:hypothetical protein
MPFWRKNKQTMPLEDFWVASIGEALQPGNRELFENDIFYILFPDARVKAEGNKRFYFEKEGLNVDDFLTYLRVAHLSSCCACAYLDDQKDFARFGQLLSSEMGGALKEDFTLHNVHATEALQAVHRAFFGQQTNHVEPWMLSGSETFGTTKALGFDRAEMLGQANVLYSFLVNYHLDRIPLITTILKQNPSKSRDSVALLIAATGRLHKHSRQTFTTI